MKRLQVEATIVMDVIHVLEYLWKAAGCFFEKGDEKVENWIAQKTIRILNGQCSQVARWSLQGAVAVLALRSLKSSGDFEEYWMFHKQQSKKRHYVFLQNNEFSL